MRSETGSGSWSRTSVKPRDVRQRELEAIATDDVSDARVNLVAVVR